MIPELIDGVLPEGIHDCTMEEVDERFGRFQRSDQRIRLTEKLRRYVEEARKTGIVVAVIVDGSYISGKAEPDDIDLILVLRPDFDPAEELRPFEYNVQSRRMVKNLYGFDCLVAPDLSPLYHKHIETFFDVRLDVPEPYTGRHRKGILRIVL